MTGKEISNIETPTLLIKSQSDRSLSLIFGIVAVFLFLWGLQYFSAVFGETDQGQYWLGFVIGAIFFAASTFSLAFAVREHFRTKKVEKEILFRKDAYAISFLDQKRGIRFKEGVWGYGFIAVLFIACGIFILELPKFTAVGFSFLILGVIAAFVSTFYVFALRPHS